MTLHSALLFFASQGNSWIYALAGLLAGGYGFARGFSLLQRKRLILDTPACKIRSASLGLVEVSGLAAGPYTMPAPISGVPCFYYHTLAWQLKQSGKNQEWEMVADESMHLPFFLDDGTGRVLVNPQRAELDVHRDSHEEYDPAFVAGVTGLPPNVAGFMARHSIRGDRRLRIDEYCIKPKNALFILGTLATNPGLIVSPKPIPTLADEGSKFQVRLNSPVSLGLGGESRPSALSVSVIKATIEGPAEGRVKQEIIRLPTAAPTSSSAAMTQQQKVAAALTRAGISNPAAWAAAGLEQPGITVTANCAEGSQGTAAAGNPSGFEERPATVLMKGVNHPAFFISWRSQRAVVQSIGWKSTAMIWGGPALILLSLYMLLAHFGWM